MTNTLGQELNPKRIRFCREFVKDLNSTQAAIRAGYSQKSARQMASRLLTKDYIKAKIRALLDKRYKKIECTEEFILDKLMKYSQADPTELVEWDYESKSYKIKEGIDGSLIKSISQTQHGLKIQLHDSLKALELLGKYKKMFTEKVEHTGKIDIEKQLILIKEEDK